jgi:RNA polymerase sigma-70 factor (ECF subfamily)
MSLFRTSYQSASDESIMSALLKGDKRAFDELYSRYAVPLKRFFLRMLWQDNAKAEDFVHDLFVKIISKPELFDNNRSFKIWVYTVAGNMCKNEYKKQAVRKVVTNGVETHYAISDQSVSVTDEVHDSFFKRSFDEQLEQLELKHREVFTLRHLEGLSIREIAEVIQANEGTVKSRLFYATKYLASALDAYNPLSNR